MTRTAIMYSVSKYMRLSETLTKSKSLRYRAVSLRQHGFLLLVYHTTAELTSQLFTGEIDIDEVSGGDTGCELYAENTKSFVDSFDWDVSTSHCNTDL